MKSFEYVITEPVGIHARPAGMLNKEARKYKSAILVHRGEKSANVLRLMALMKLGVKCGETVKVTIEGEDVTKCSTSDISSKLKGTPGTKVRLSIERVTTGKVEEFEIERS